MSDAPSIAIVVLAAGMGTRFRSSIPKVLHPANGDPLIAHVLRAAASSRPEARLLVVVGHGRDQVEQEVGSRWPEAELVDQPEPLGTGDAVLRCRDALAGFSGTVLILNGDAPLVRPESLDAFVESHRSSGSPVSLLVAKLRDPTGYGRIVRDSLGQFEAIVEEADADESQRRITEVSTGIWCFEADDLFDALSNISPANAQGEYYLPDAALVIHRLSGRINLVIGGDEREVGGVNDRAQLADASAELRRRRVTELAHQGVTIEDPLTTYIEQGVTVGKDTVIRPMTFLKGETKIGQGCVVGPSVEVTDSVIEDGAQVRFAMVVGAHIGPDATVGPFAYLRPGASLARGAKVGTFVEVKGSTIGEGSKVPHLSYIGDAEIGSGVNLGAGTITGNYDTEGKKKSKTVVEDGAFTGSDTTLVAPVRLGKGAGTGAGSVVTKDVAEGEIVAGVPARPFRKRREDPRDNG